MATITSAQTGSWSATATWVGGVVPVEGDKVNIAAGHVVTVDGTYTVGNGSFSASSSAAVYIQGTLKASRTTSSSFTCKGLIYVATGGFLDYGTVGDEIPAAYTAELVLNKPVSANAWNDGVTIQDLSLTLSKADATPVQFHGYSGWTPMLTSSASVSAGSNTITVVGSLSNWSDGDTVYISSGNLSITQPEMEIMTIASGGISGSTITFTTNFAYPHLAGVWVMNGTRNVKIRPYTAIDFVNSRIKGGRTCVDAHYAEFIDLGRATNYGAITTNLGTSSMGYGWHNILDNVVFNYPNITYGNKTAFYQGRYYMNDCIVPLRTSATVNAEIRSVNSYHGSNSYGNRDSLYTGCMLDGCGEVADAVYTNCTFTGEATGIIGVGYGVTATITDCDVGNTYGFSPASATDRLTRLTGKYDNSGQYFLKGCYFQTNLLDLCTGMDAAVSNQADNFYVEYSQVNKDPDVNFAYTNGYKLTGDSTTKKRSNFSLQYAMWASDVLYGNPKYTELEIFVPNGNTITVVCNVYVDSTFYNSGTWTAPYAEISGLDITPVTATATSASSGAWEKLTLTATNDQVGYAGYLKFRFYVQRDSVNNSGNVYLDGLPIPPFSTRCRHYGYRLDQEASVTRTVNPLISELDESVVGAYTGVTINGSTSEISFSAGTANDLNKFYDYSQLWACDNILKDVPLTRAGASYTLTDGWKVIDPYYSGTLTWSGGTVEYTTYGTYDDNLDSNIIEFSGVGGGSYTFTGSIGGTVDLRNNDASAITVYFPAGTSYTTASNSGGTITVQITTATFTITSNQSATIRYFASGSQTPLDSTTGTSLGYIFSSTDPIDIEVLKDGYVPFRASGVTPYDGSYSVTLKSDPVYISGHGLTYTTDYSYNRTTKVLTITAAQEGRSIYSSLIEQYRTNSTLFNTDFLMTAIGIDRIDFTDGMTIDSGDIQFWKGAGMQWYTSGDTVNPTHKFCSIKSVGTIAPSASCYVQQVYGGTPVALTLSGSNKIDSVVQYWSDPNHDGSVADGYDYSGFLLFKTFKDGYYQGRTDVIQAYGISELESYEYTINLSNVATGLGTGTRGLTITVTDHTAAPIDPQSSGDYFDYKITEASNAASAEDILRQWIYDISSDPTATYNGKTAANWGDPLYLNGSSYETKVMYVEGQETSTDQHGTYVEQASDYHPGFNRQQANDLSYWVTPLIVTVDMPNIIDGSRVYLYNEDASSVIDNSVVAGGSGYSKVINNFTTNINVSYRVCYQSGATAKYPLVGTGVITSSGLTITATQTDDAVHNNYGVDGSTVTELTADYANIQIDVNDADNVFDARRGVAWWRYITQTSQGIASYNPNAISYAPDIYNIVVDGALQIENIKAAALKITNGVWTRSDGGDLIASTSNTIHWIPDNRVYSAVVETGVSGLTAAESAKIDLISGIDVRVDDIHKIHGLDSVNPVTVTPTSRSVGNVTQQITGDGQTTSTVTRL